MATLSTPTRRSSRNFTPVSGGQQPRKWSESDNIKLVNAYNMVHQRKKGIFVLFFFFIFIMLRVMIGHETKAILDERITKLFLDSNPDQERTISSVATIWSIMTKVYK